MKVGNTLKLGNKLKVSPGGAAAKLTWKSSDKKIAKVSSDGVVTGIMKGTVTITVTAQNGVKVKIKVKVR